jgi:crotonobetainyl-CoA:carnitine CoA-transferase CaiB-like acyl-CoA transferase
MLAPYRVLDLSDERGLFCGQTLGDLGADVIQIEPPGGSSARRHGPFAGDVPDPNRSLAWWAATRNKRSLVLDLTRPEGRAQLLRLVRTSHFFIESSAPGTLAALDLGYDALAAVNPALIYVSITPYGRTGPRAHWADSDLVVWAAGGPLVLTGDGDRAPVRLPVPQTYLHASADAAVAALIAHHERVRSGRGQHVDVSAQQAVTLATQSYSLCAALGHPPVQRSAGGLVNGPLHVRLLFPARDGAVAITFLFGSAIGPFSRRLMDWICEEGGCDAATRDKDWLAYSERLLSGAEPLAEFERVKRVVADFTRTRTKAALLDAALARGLLIAPVATIDEVLASPQLAARHYWTPLAHPELGHDVVYPGPFARFGASPIRYRRRPPLIGEHTDEILRERRALLAVPSLPSPPPASGTGALADVRILDFMWVMAGPAATRMLADYGAQVVRVESTRHIDTARTLAPFHGGQPGTERSGVFQNLNLGKRMLTLDVRTPEGRAVVLDLVRWADVVTESFSPGRMAALGLDYATLRAVNPRLVMLSTCLMGQTGPRAQFAGYGNLAAAISGFSNLGGWPDRPPAGPFSAYTDYVSPRFIALAILAALEHRRRTGEGQHVDCSQAESSLHFLTPALLDYTVNGRVAGRVGNRDREAVPHGVFPSAGTDTWIAIAVDTEARWAALCALMDQPALATDERFATAARRRTHEDALEAIVARWTASHDADGLAGRLQTAGIPAYAVQNSPELQRDPQLAARGHFRSVAHPTLGPSTVEGSRFVLSRTPATLGDAAPTYGADNDLVLRDVLGYDDDRVTALVLAGALV